MNLLETRRKTPEISIIPLIDILAILLIFFIVSTTFKKPRPVLEIDLPTVKELPTTKVMEERKILAVDESGQVSLNHVSVPMEELAEHLVAFKNVNPNAELELETDDQITITQLFEVWDALTKAGIEIKDVPARIKLPQ